MSQFPFKITSIRTTILLSRNTPWLAVPVICVSNIASSIWYVHNSAQPLAYCCYYVHMSALNTNLHLRMKTGGEHSSFYVPQLFSVDICKPEGATYWLIMALLNPQDKKMMNILYRSSHFVSNTLKRTYYIPKWLRMQLHEQFMAFPLFGLYMDVKDAPILLLTWLTFTCISVVWSEALYFWTLAKPLNNGLQVGVK